MYKKLLCLLLLTIQATFASEPATSNVTLGVGFMANDGGIVKQFFGEGVRRAPEIAYGGRHWRGLYSSFGFRNTAGRNVKGIVLTAGKGAGEVSYFDLPEAFGIRFLREVDWF